MGAFLLLTRGLAGQTADDYGPCCVQLKHDQALHFGAGKSFRPPLVHQVRIISRCMLAGAAQRRAMLLNT